MRIAFIVKGDPFSWKCHEALRVAMALGINSEVSLIFIKDGVYALTKWHPEELGIELLIIRTSFLLCKDPFHLRQGGYALSNLQHTCFVKGPHTFFASKVPYIF